MSKVKIEGNASGTGTLTIAAPNTNVDRTLTLPDGAGEILTDASSLPAANLTGTLPAIDGSALTDVVPDSTPVFVAENLNATTLTGAAWNIQPYTTVHTDTHGFWNTSSHRFQPNIAGWYLINFSNRTLSVTSTYVIAALWKNGSLYQRGDQNNATSYCGVSYTGIVYMNVTTEYCYATVLSATGVGLEISSGNNWISGTLLRAA